MYTKVRTQISKWWKWGLALLIPTAYAASLLVGGTSDLVITKNCYLEGANLPTVFVEEVKVVDKSDCAGRMFLIEKDVSKETKADEISLIQRASVNPADFTSVR